jgi:hypothetical protein
VKCALERIKMHPGGIGQDGWERNEVFFACTSIWSSGASSCNEDTEYPLARLARRRAINESCHISLTRKSIYLFTGVNSTFYPLIIHL